MALCGNRRAMVESRGFNGNKTSESRERTEDERTETTIPEAIAWAFQAWMERNAERLCASVVYTRRKRLIKTVCRKEKLRKL